jgi:outer membrane protein OmpU
MKKILLATSALVLVAGAAAAEVAVSGSARMGIVYDGTDAQFSSRVRIVFTASGESDAGFSFGASVRADQFGGNQKTDSNGDTVGSSGTTNDDSTVYISGGFGKLTMGDAGNAPDALVGQVSGIGYTGLGDLNEIGFLDTDKTGVLYEYSAGAVSFALGSAQIDSTNDTLSLAVKYATDAFAIALGYEDGATEDQISALGSATFGGATVKLKLVDNDAAADMAAALSVDYTTGATTITAFATDNRDFAGQNTVGLGVAYDLGGGASFKAGVADNDTDTVAELGMNFSF